MGIEKVILRLTRQLEGPVLDTCLAIVVRLSDIPFDQAQRLTFRHLYDWAGHKVEEDTFYAALTALTSVKRHPLILYFVFYDEWNDIEIAVSAQQAYDAAERNEFFNPETGEEIEDFLEKLFPVYRMSPIFFVDVHGYEP